jgi:hypothetical protein
VLDRLDAEADRVFAMTRPEEAAHPSWCERGHSGHAHTGRTVHVVTKWSAPGRGVDIDIVDIGSRDAADPVIRVLFLGHTRGELLALTEARTLATTLVDLAGQADAG